MVDAIAVLAIISVAGEAVVLYLLYKFIKMC